MDNRLLTTEEVSEFLSVPRSTLADWRYKGRGPRYFRVGNGVRYAKDDLLAWLDERAA